MREQMYMVVDIDRCWGCRACQVACKREHGISPDDFKPIEAFRLENKLGTEIRCEYMPVLCQHCDDPACVKACPKQAISRTEEGLIEVDEPRCIGCGLCVKACPYGAVGLKRDAAGKRNAVKCDLCAERRSRGYLTACEQHCLGGVFTSCTAGQRDDIIKDYPYLWNAGRIIYVSRRLSDLGKMFSE